MFRKKGGKVKPALKNEELEDAEFEALREVMQTFKSGIKSVRDEVTAYRAAIKSLASPFDNMAEHIVSLYDGDEPGSSVVGTRMASASATVDGHIQTLVAQLTDFIEFLSEKNKELHALRNSVETRDKALKAYDKAKKDHAKALTSKDTSKSMAAETKVNKTKAEFETAHSAVIDELTSLDDSRFDQFNGHYGEFIDSQLGMFRGVSNAWMLVAKERYPMAVPVLVPVAVVKRRKEERKKAEKDAAKKKKKDTKKEKAKKGQEEAEQDEDQEDESGSEFRKFGDENDDDEDEDQFGADIGAKGSTPGFSGQDSSDSEDDDDEDKPTAFEMAGEVEEEEVWADTNPFGSPEDDEDDALDMNIAPSSPPELDSSSASSESSEDSHELDFAMGGASSNNVDNNDLLGGLADIDFGAAPVLVPSNSRDESVLQPIEVQNEVNEEEVMREAGDKLNQAYKLLEQGEFEPARASADCSLKLLVSVKDPSKLQVQIKACTAYVLALSVLVRCNELEKQAARQDDPEEKGRIMAEIAMLGSFLTDIPLRAQHRIACCRVGIQRNADVGNWGVTNKLITRILAANPADADDLRTKQAYCESQGNANANAIPYKLVCFHTLAPVVGTPHRCPVCQALFSPSAVAASEKCPICERGDVA